MLARQLRHRITIQSNQPVQDTETGEVVPSWADLHTNVAAGKASLSGKDLIAAAASQSKLIARFKIRFKAGLDETMRIVHKGIVYNIEAVLPDPDSNKEYLTIHVSYGVNDG